MLELASRLACVLVLTGCSGNDSPPAGGSGGSGPGGSSAGGAAGCQAAQAPFGADPAAGQSFPDLQVTRCDGTRLHLDELRCQHQLTLISIGAGWCQPCIAETPDLEAAKKELEADEIGVIQILFEDAQGQPATTLFCENWVNTFGLTLPVLIDPPGNTLDYFDQAVTPLNLIVDRRGKVLWSITGVIPKDLVGTARGLLPK